MERRAAQSGRKEEARGAREEAHDGPRDIRSAALMNTSPAKNKHPGALLVPARVGPRDEHTEGKF